VSLAALGVVASPAHGQAASIPVPESAYLNWENVRLVASPDSGKMFLFVNEGDVEANGPFRFFATTADPAAVTTWVNGAREFLRQKLDRNDTGQVRISPVLQGDRARVYVGRRRERGNWSSERILVFERLGTQNPMLFAPKEKDLLRILDTLEAVARRTPPERRGPDPLAERLGPVTEGASVVAGTRAPPFPPGEQVAQREGLVLLTFVVGVDGKADMATVKVIHATDAAFLQSVLQSLANYQFNPASFRGTKVRQRLIYPFQFFFKR
jgi:hypothetical protein